MTELTPPLEDHPAASALTPGGRGAVATVLFRGDCRRIDDAELFGAANQQPLARQPVGRIVFGHWGDRVKEEVVVCRTDDSAVEIHCHGGDAAVGRILSDLERAGCSVVTWQQMESRTRGRLETECLEALSSATTFRTASILAEQHSGLLRSALQELARQLAGGQEDGLELARVKLKRLLDWADFGCHLATAWNVVLAGRPNVGKSSLINRLVGYKRSIVFDQPGTTRDVVTAETALDGWPVRFADTAGIRSGAGALEGSGIERARGQLAEADCRLLLFDVSRPPADDDFQLLEDIPDPILVAHKCDLTDLWGHRMSSRAIRVSSKTGEGVDQLARLLVERLVPHIPPPGTAMPVCRRQVECLRSVQAALEQGRVRQCQRALDECVQSRL